MNPISFGTTFTAKPNHSSGKDQDMVNGFLQQSKLAELPDTVTIHWNKCVDNSLQFEISEEGVNKPTVGSNGVFADLDELDEEDSKKNLLQLLFEDFKASLNVSEETQGQIAELEADSFPE